MAVQNIQAKPVGFNSYLVTWSSTLERPTFRIYRDGALLHVTHVNHCTVHVRDGDAAHLEVIDNAVDAPMVAGAGHAVIGWDPVSGAVRYRIQRKVDGDWTPEAEKPASVTGHESYVTSPLEGGEQAEFRVIAVGADGNESTPVIRNITAARHPLPPSLDWTLNESTRQVTIAAAS